METQRNRVTSGLEKLMTASSEIKRMKVQLIEKESALEFAQQRAREYLQEIAQQTREAEQVRTAVAAKRDRLQEERDLVNLQKQDAEQELVAAEPALQRAAEALLSIQAGDIAALRKMQKPPNLIKRIMDGVLILNYQEVLKVTEDPEVPRADKSLGIAPRKLLTPSWASSLRMMTSGTFLQDLLRFEKDRVTDETCELLQPYLEMTDFTTETARKVSGSVAGLCTWIKSMVEYHDVAQMVEPKRRAVFDVLYLIIIMQYSDSMIGRNEAASGRT